MKRRQSNKLVSSIVDKMVKDASNESLFTKSEMRVVMSRYDDIMSKVRRTLFHNAVNKKNDSIKAYK